MALRFLVVEGNTRPEREKHERAFGKIYAAGYAALVERLAAAADAPARADIAYPADEGANLPDGAGLADYDGVFLTGSALNLYDMTPPIRRQIELVRTVMESGTPCFGSCWGVQVGAAAAGGSVAKNPAGREVGFARRIVATAEGAGHPLLAGRPAAFDAPAIHLDMVETVPEGATVLATNAVTAVQAMEIRRGESVFWGVQYHPEYGLDEMAAILDRYGEKLVGEGFCADLAAAEGFVADLRALDADPVGRTDLAWRYGLDAEILDPMKRTREISNFIEAVVKPRAVSRGRA